MDGQVSIKIIEDGKESEIILTLLFGTTVATYFRSEILLAQGFEIECTCKPTSKYYLRTLLCECQLSVKEDDPYDPPVPTCTVL